MGLALTVVRYSLRTSVASVFSPVFGFGINRVSINGISEEDVNDIHFLA